MMIVSITYISVKEMEKEPCFQVEILSARIYCAGFNCGHMARRLRY